MNQDCSADVVGQENKRIITTSSDEMEMNDLFTTRLRHTKANNKN